MVMCEINGFKMWIKRKMKGNEVTHTHVCKILKFGSYNTRFKSNLVTSSSIIELGSLLMWTVMSA